MLRKVPLAPLEWYHLYTRGIDKRVVFQDDADFRRFKKLLYLGNDTAPINLELLKELPYQEVFTLERKEQLVAIGAYCLMTNHPHLLIQQRAENGITRFMRKIGTAYTMYFNKKYDRIGNLMVKPFRSKHVGDDLYFRKVTQYIHLNSAEIFEHGWKNGKVGDIEKLKRQVLGYTHSSLYDYASDPIRPEHAILDPDAFTIISDGMPPLEEVLSEAHAYYKEIECTFDPKPRGRPKLKGDTF